MDSRAGQNKNRLKGRTPSVATSKPTKRLGQLMETDHNEAARRVGVEPMKEE